MNERIIDNYELFDCEIAKLLYRLNKQKRLLGLREIKECPFKQMCERKDKFRYIYCKK